MKTETIMKRYNEISWALVIAIWCVAVISDVTIPSRFIPAFMTSPEIFLPHTPKQVWHFPHVIPPRRSIDKKHTINEFSDVTLRQYLSNSQGFHLALAPAFFGFYVYFGALTAFHENVLIPNDRIDERMILPVCNSTATSCGDRTQETLLKSVAGASAGAMAAVLIASGLNPRESAEFASTMTFDKFADPPGYGGFLKGNMFEKLMVERLNSRTRHGEGMEGESRKLENGYIPVAVTGFDLFSMSGKILTEGCMGRAARASATFPGLFQPVGWIDSKDKNKTDGGHGYLTSLKQRYIPDALLIDGGVTDPIGINGLSALLPNVENKRIVTISLNGFGSPGPLGPSAMPIGLHASEVVSISIENTPACGPWAMSNGPRAVHAAREAIKAVLDLPMYRGEEDGHYVIRVNAKSFVPN